ncbi:MAG: hypothetical protein EHM58_06820 [Ignavibacteriae bacterium]|nr:MAG: hypothetical protein EHM58_06820 [Ignavibacteriota bacterium]
MKSVSIFSILLLIYSHAFSQDTTAKHSLQLIVGLSDFHVRDEFASSLIYRNTNFAVEGEYMIKTDKSIQSFQLAGYNAVLKTNLEKYDAENFRVSFRYNYLHNISKYKIWGNDLNIFLGGGGYSLLNFSQYNEYISEYGVLTESWYWVHSAEVSAFANYNTGSNNLGFAADFSLISNVSRPQYSYIPGTYRYSHINPFGKMEVFWNNPSVHIKIIYGYQLSSRFQILAQYNFQYSYFDEPRIIGLYMNNFLTGVRLSL